MGSVYQHVKPVRDVRRTRAGGVQRLDFLLHLPWVLQETRMSSIAAHCACVRHCTPCCMEPGIALMLRCCCIVDQFCEAQLHDDAAEAHSISLRGHLYKCACAACKGFDYSFLQLDLGS